MLVVQTECYHHFKLVRTTSADAAAIAEPFKACWLHAPTGLKLKN
jgi:hypothetical protein